MKINQTWLTINEMKTKLKSHIPASSPLSRRCAHRAVHLPLHQLAVPVQLRGERWQEAPAQAEWVSTTATALTHTRCQMCLNFFVSRSNSPARILATGDVSHSPPLSSLLFPAELIRSCPCWDENMNRFPFGSLCTQLNYAPNVL